MRHCLRCFSLVLILLVLVGPLASAQNSDEPVLLLESASGAYDLDGEDVLIIQDISGTLSLRAATNETLRFEGRSLSSQREMQDVALWRSGKNTLLLGPGTEVGAEGTLVDMVVPDGLDVDVLMVGGRVLISAIAGDLVVEAENAKVQARGLRGSAEFLLSGGTLVIDGVKGELSIEATDVTAEIQHLYESAELNLKLGRTTINGSEGDVEVESEKAAVVLTKVLGEVRVEANGGTLGVNECSGGGDFNLEETALSLVSSKGDYTVRSDARVEFMLHEGSLRVLNYGAPIQGSQISGPLFIENNSSSVDLKQLSGKTEIRGNELKLTIDDCQGPLNVQTVSSEIAINASRNEVVIENDFGDVRTSGTKASLTIKSRGGNVHVQDHQGALELRADGPEVRVDWTKFSTTDAMSVQNESGDVYLGLPAAGRCNLQANAPFGRVDSQLPGVRVADDGKSARGEYSGGRGKAPQVKKPLVNATSGGGNVYVGMASGKE